MATSFFFNTVTVASPGTQLGGVSHVGGAIQTVPLCIPRQGLSVDDLIDAQYTADVSSPVTASLTADGTRVYVPLVIAYNTGFYNNSPAFFNNYHLYASIPYVVQAYDTGFYNQTNPFFRSLPLMALNAVWIQAFW